MKSRSDLLTAAGQDWPEENLLRLRATLAASYMLAEQQTDPIANPFYDTPNRSHARGYLRWILLDSHLVKACQAGFLIGLTPYWVTSKPENGCVQSLELRGKTAATMVHHLAHPTDVARDSLLRFDRRSKNELKTSPFLNGFEPPYAEEGDDELVNVTIVHGDKRAEFAYLRIYDDSLNLRSFIPASGNIMSMSQPLPAAEEEEVKEAEIVLRKDLFKRKAR